MEEKHKDAAIEAPSTATATAENELVTPPRRRGGGQKRKLSNVSGPSTSLKRQAREKLFPVPIHNGPCTRARQQPWPSTEPLLSKTEAAPPEVDEITPAQKEWDALEAKIQAHYHLITSRDPNSHVVPIPSGWFSWTKLHPLEERALPSFFNGKSKNRSPEIYMEIRNWIMNRFHSNPSSQIELKDLSELSVGELDARQEVLEFLDYWGLINYHPLPETAAAADLTVNGDNRVLKTGSLVEKLYKFEMEQSCTPVVPRANVAAPTVTPGLFPESTVAEEVGKAEGPSVEYHCNSCSADCSRRRYHCQKEADFDLCTECFNSGKFGSYMSPSDFILMEPADAAGASSGKWTDQETLLLLEALELYKENWSEIAEHVATKTKTQCILHFIQMPIEDTFLDRDDDMDNCTKEDADPVSTLNDALAPKDVSAIESKDQVCEDQPLSSTMEISKLEDTSEPNTSQEIGENCALKALRDAFEAVGSLPSSEGKLSFAEAGNPVMALAAFLVRLVEPNVVTASARSSLKSISANGSGAQLAARHCFLLEDPSDEEKNTTDSERDVAKTIEQEHHKDESKNDGEQVEEKPGSVLDSSNPSNDRDYGKNKDDVTEEERLFVPPNGECTDKSSAPKESTAIVTHEEVEPSIPIKSDTPDLTRIQEPNAADESNDIVSKDEPPPKSAKESVDEVLVGGTSLSIDALKDEASAGGISQSTDAPKNEASVEGTASQSTDTPKDEELISDSLSPRNKVLEQPITSDPVVEKETNAGEEEAEESKDCKDANEDPSKTKNDIKSDKIKQAAVTAISAAAVKAKLLANHEEDQIRELAKLLVEKQLHKLETKLSFFTEMEGVVMRVREQLERSKQRLYHERAQIIAARLGMSAPSSRPMQQTLPVNRTAMAFSNSAQRPPMSMISQRPPISRSIMPSAPTTSNPFAPVTVAGNSVQPSNQDKISSVAMK